MPLCKEVWLIYVVVSLPGLDNVVRFDEFPSCIVILGCYYFLVLFSHLSAWRQHPPIFTPSGLSPSRLAPSLLPPCRVAHPLSCFAWRPLALYPNTADLRHGECPEMEI